MKILVVGGAGFIGSYVSLFLDSLGHDVTIMSRSAPSGKSGLSRLSYIKGNYIEDNCGDGRLEGFDWLVMCAGNDLRNYPRDEDVSQADYFERANIVSLPKFFEDARRAGISRTVYLGSYYSYISPESTETIPYVRSRHLSDAAVRSLSTPDFNVCSCALPWIVGFTPGLINAQWQTLSLAALGQLDLPDFVPPGGGNFMTCHSVAQAVLGGLRHGESGRSYLVGDVNLSWQEYFNLWFEAAGQPRHFRVLDQDHPVLPREVVAYNGGTTPDYQPVEEERRLLGYDRGVLRNEVTLCLEYYRNLSAGR